ncbi:AraC family transcriptional regulator [Streptomyces physcomitrii]|uniref:AraC family transcriptional regulator n=1 Tax=Streptomyces physcomitrii TaxID=2724184 RepID=UPI0033F69ED0
MSDLDFRGEELAGPERFEHWRTLALDSTVPTDLSSEHVEEFECSLRGFLLGPVKALTTTCPTIAARRTRRHIGASDPEMYELCLPQQGTGHLDLGRAGTVSFGPGTVVVGTTSLPFVSSARAQGGLVSVTKFYVPRRLVPIPAHNVDTLLARPLPTGEGVGALFGQLLLRLTEESDTYRPADRARLGTVVADMFAAVLAHHLDAERSIPPESHRRTLFLRTQDFIRRNLHDPWLTADTVAAAHHISTRYLYRLYQDNGLTVRAWIRDQRLERSARELADPARVHLRINELATRWGFSHPAAFSRAFRDAHGLAPSDYRRLHLSPAAP